jgi:hypothetical protein
MLTRCRSTYVQWSLLLQLLVTLLGCTYTLALPLRYTTVHCCPLKRDCTLATPLLLRLNASPHMTRPHT